MKTREKSKSFVIIDGNAVVHRAFHALPPLTSPKGAVVNAVFGFCSFLLKTIKELKPDYITATFDLPGPTFRHEQFEAYKAKRVKAPQELYDQIPLVKGILKAFGIPVYEKAGFEADDVIGTLATTAKKLPDLNVIIATGDLDSLQLVDDDLVTVFTLRKGLADTILYDEKAVEARYGLKPSQLNEYRGLKGDPSDNIPGVPGVGEKTASTLIQKFGTLEKMYEALEKKKEIEGVSEKLAEKLLANKDQAFFSRQLSQIVCDLELNFSLDSTEWKTHFERSEVEKMFREFGFSSLIKRIDDLKETSSIDSRQPSMDIFAKLWFIEKGSIVGHDIKQAYKEIITGEEETPRPLFDTKIAAYMLNIPVPDFDFRELYYAEFHESVEPSRETIEKLATRLGERLDAGGLRKPFETIEMPLIPVLADMERAGVVVNLDTLAELGKLVDAEAGELEKKIYAMAGGEFNISSPAQLGEILFTKLGLKTKVRKTAGGALSTRASELEKLRGEHEVVELVMRYRELQKLKTTYIDPFPSFVKGDGRIHSTFDQTGTVTGRLSSQDPNLQNIPIRTELGRQFRKAFVSAPGYELISFDYSQIDLRMVAHLADDERMIEAFRKGEDIHTRTACEVYDVTPENVTPIMRRHAKALNFGIVYGMGSVSFARTAGLSRDEAAKFIHRYFSEFSGVARYMEDIKEKARAHGYVETLFGHRRLLPELSSGIVQVRAQGERMAINMPVQGTAADVVKMAMISTFQFCHENKYREKIRMILQIHDELVFEVASGLVSEIIPKIKKIMESVYTFKVPIVVEAKHGPNLLDMANTVE